MRRIVAVLCLCGLASILPFLLLLWPPFWQDLPGYPLKIGDLLDVFTPWIESGIFALLYVWIPAASTAEDRRRSLFRLLFWVAAVALIEGHGMHLAANAISRRTYGGAPRDMRRLIYLFDEYVGHSFRYAGALVLALTTVAYQYVHPTWNRMSPSQGWLLALGGGIYGGALAIGILEGRQVIWAAPLTLLAVSYLGWRLLRIRSGVLHFPAWVFFLTGFVVLLLALAAWVLYFGAFLEPSTLISAPPP